MSAPSVHRWHDGHLHSISETELTALDTSPIVVADSWLAVNGRTLALSLHRARFERSLPVDVAEQFPAFWRATLDVVPRSGRWFPRVEYHHAESLAVRVRTAPDALPTAVLATLDIDPRTTPATKGPDLHRLQSARDSKGAVGATEVVILSPDGFVVDGGYSALLWWRGEILCRPLDEFARVDSVTARSIIAMASALGVPTYAEAVTPAELAGTELWAVSALHGIRLVTAWIDGPALAERPGRAALWRSRLEALTRGG